MTLDDARKVVEKSEPAWSARPWDRRLQRQLREARAPLARVQRETEQRGQLTLGEEPEG